MQRLFSQIYHHCKGKSQNHRIVGVGMDLKRSESNPPAIAGTLQQVIQVGVQTGLEYLHRRRCYHLPGQPVPVLRHPHHKVLSHLYGAAYVQVLGHDGG